MASAAGTEVSAHRLERFDGSDPSAYKRWRRRAELMLISLPSTYPKEKLGPKLIEYLAGDAELATEHLSVEELAVEGGEKKIFKVLDERFKPLEKDDLHEALTEYFHSIAIKPGESMKAFVNRYATCYRKLLQQKVSLPNEVQGWFMMQKMRLDSSQQALILTATSGDYHVEKVTSAVKAVLANAKGSAKPKETLVAEEMVESDEDDADLLQVFAAEIQSKDTYDDEEVLDVYETYKQVRTKMQEFKKNRGFRPTTAGRPAGPFRLHGSISARIEQAKAHTQCHICKQFGHWKRECKLNPSKAGGPKGPPKEMTKEVHIVDPSSDESLDIEAYAQLFQEVEDEMHEVSAKADTLVHEQLDEPKLFKKALGQSHHFQELDKSAESSSSHQYRGSADSFETLSSKNQDVFAESDYEAHAALDTHGVPDTACRRSLIGENVLERLEQHVRHEGLTVKRVPGTSTFKFGNAQQLKSHEFAIVPCTIGGRKVVLKLAVLPGAGAETPLLMSKELLKTLGVVLDTTSDTMLFKHLGGVTVKLGITERGHYAVPLFEESSCFVTCTPNIQAQHTVEIVTAQDPRVESNADSEDGRTFEPRQSGAPGTDGPTSGDGPSWSTSPSLGPTARLGGGLPSSPRVARHHSHDRGQVQAKGRSQGPHHERGLYPGQELSHMGASSHHQCEQHEHATVEAIHRTERCSEDRKGESRDISSDSHSSEKPSSAHTQDAAGSRVSHIHSSPMQHMECGEHPGDQSSPWQRRGHGGGSNSSGEVVPVHGESAGRKSNRCPCIHSQCGDGAQQPRDITAHAAHSGTSDGPQRTRLCDRAREPIEKHDDMFSQAVCKEESCGTANINRKQRRKLRKVVEELESYSDYDAWICGLRKKMAPSVTELFSVPRVNDMCHEHGIKQGENYDLMLGDDLLDKHEQRRVLQEIHDHDPFLVVVSPPCTMFSLRRMMGTDIEEEKRKLRNAFVLLEFGVRVCWEQMKRHRFFLFEHPQSARSWSSKVLSELAKQEGVSMVDFDMCCFGMRDRISGKLHKKTTRFLGNLQREIMLSFLKRCTGDHDHQTLEGRVKFEGKWVNRTRLAQEYPYDLCSAICKAVLQQHALEQETHPQSTEVFEGFAVEKLQGDDVKQLEETIRRAHQNLGHPGVERFVEMLRAAGANDKAIMVARKHKCSTCEAQQGLKATKVSKVRKTYEFNVGVCCDTFTVHWGDDKELAVFSIICEGTNFHLAFPLWGGKTANETRRAYRKNWKAVFGSPVRLFTDGGPEFEGNFQEGLQLDGAADDRSAAYAPWQNSLIERHGQTWKQMFAKMCVSNPPSNREDVEELFEQINIAKNTMVNRSGFSPHQRVFGKSPRIPGMLHSHDDSIVVNSGFLAGDPSYVKALNLRQEARKAFIEADHEERVRRAIEHRTRPERGPFVPGCKVFIWRPGNIKKDGEKAWFWKGPGTVIGSADASKIWVSLGSKVFKCAPEQLRRLKPEDEAAIKLVPEELIDWNHQTSKRGVATFHDVSGEERPKDVFQRLHEEDFWEFYGIRLRRVHVKPRTTAYTPSVDDCPPIGLDKLTGTRKTTMTDEDECDQVVYDDWREAGAATLRSAPWKGYTDFMMKREHYDDVDFEVEHERNVRPRLDESAQIPDEDLLEYSPTTPAESIAELASTNDTSELNPPDSSMIQVTPNPETTETTQSTYGPVRTTSLTRALRHDPEMLDSGRPARRVDSDDLLATELAGGRWLDKQKNWKIDWNNKVLIRRHDWRKQKYVPPQRECPVPRQWLTGKRYTLARSENQDDEFFITEDDNVINAGNVESLGKWWSGYSVFEFDVLLHEMNEDFMYEVNEVTLTETTKQNLDEWAGKKAELEKLLKYGAVEIIGPKEASRIRQTTNRILPSRFVITKKPDEKNPGKYITKARWCVRGYLDPDIGKLTTQAATLSTEAMCVILQMSATKGWNFNICDIEGAFLQGNELHRPEGELYVELPPGGIPGIQPGSLLFMRKAVYGLIDAPKEWFGKLRTTLEEIGLVASVLDPCLYYARKGNQTIGALAVHVDDIISTGTAEFEETILQRLKQTFPFKHWKVNEGEFLGRYLKKNTDGVIEIGQQEYSEKLTGIEITRERRRQRDSPLREEERSKLRGVAGALNWLTNATRPDLASYTACIQQRISQGTVKDMAFANQVIAEARDFKHLKVQIQPLPWEKLALIVTADASWTTEDDLRSQGAYMICTTTTDMEKGNTCPVNPMKWKSKNKNVQ